MEEIRSYWGVGTITSQGSKGVQFRVRSIKELSVVINHFDKYPLITKKRADFILWCQIIMMIIRKEHLTQKGLIAIVNIRASINLGLSDELKEAFPNTVSVKRPLVVDQVIRDPHWLAGFTPAEGCFFVNTTKSKTHSSGYQVRLRFQLTQHGRTNK